MLPMLSRCAVGCCSGMALGTPETCAVSSNYLLYARQKKLPRALHSQAACMTEAGRHHEDPAASSQIHDWQCMPHLGSKSIMSALGVNLSSSAW
jgi:hypothetical protein